ncbi:hypothetical protein Purlil1_4632 [Purpureocillium lilacinum]|uniref:Uncharacterized protein n=1 Tax=Purpureocillium lilacinum TaxID=33203 RepID=A0ABR0C3Z4_PURLI|nr:hypothetical protein Purlil1_4632 [Purpureocillium lilacinum]
MATSPRQITVENHSGSTQSYFFFNEALGTSNSAGKTLNDLWVKSPDVVSTNDDHAHPDVHVGDSVTNGTATKSARSGETVTWSSAANMETFRAEKLRIHYYGLDKPVATHPVDLGAVGDQPDVTGEATPKEKYFIGTGYRDGTDLPVDTSALENGPEVDFAQAASGQTVAVIKHYSDGTFSHPIFHYPDDALARTEP